MEVSIYIIIAIVLGFLVLRKIKKTVTKIIMLAVIVLIAYATLTTHGAMRFGVVRAAPFEMSAYTTDLIINTGRSTEDKIVYATEEGLDALNGSDGYYECENYFIFKYCKFYGF